MTLFNSDPEQPMVFKQCFHRMDPVVMPDNVTFYASSHHKRGPGDEKPDYGFYLDSIWQPDTIAFYTHWKDFGLPTLPVPRFVELLRFVKDYAGYFKVEVGCIGGHGRTGTALACFAVLGGATAQEAMDLIRDEYCHKTIEVDVQEWLVEAVWCELQGQDYPEMPPPPPPLPPLKGKQVTNFAELGRCEKNANLGKLAKVKTDASGIEYCSLCLVDIPGANVLECFWCAATLKGVARHGS